MKLNHRNAKAMLRFQFESRSLASDGLHIIRHDPYLNMALQGCGNPVVSRNSAERFILGFTVYLDHLRPEMSAERCALKLYAIRKIGRLAPRDFVAIGVLN